MNGAKQLSTNIGYMKYAMGSIFAPVIEYITNLVYKLMKAIQSVVYAFSGINIFAKATASSMKSTAGSAKQASKSLSGVHSEINNVSENKGNSGGSGDVAPSMDLSKMENTSNSILDAIKKGDWYLIGVEIGNKINQAMESIPWEKIQNTARTAGKNIAQFFNGSIKTIDWYQAGNTLAQGLNTVIYFAYSFVTTFDWSQFGKAIGDSINGFFDNIDWATLGQTVGESFKGVFTTLYTALEEIDWQQLATDAEIFINNIDWAGVSSAFFRTLGAAFGGLAGFLGKIIGDAVTKAKEYFNKKIKESGGNIVAGILEGIADALIDIGNWINDNIFKPFIEGFKNAFGIHSPSTVMKEQGGYIIDGLKEGLTGIWDKVKSKFEEFKTKVIEKFDEIKTKLSNWAEDTKGKISTWADTTKNKFKDCFENISSKVGNKLSDMKSNINSWTENIKSKWSNHWNNMGKNVESGLNTAKSKISNWSENISSTFSKIGSQATTWGKDLVTNMANGIKNNVSKVTNAVNSVASKIKGLLGFSEPKEGPLSNFHTYMPDMIDLMIKGIHDNMNKVTNELDILTSKMSFSLNNDILGDIPKISNSIKVENINNKSSMYDTVKQAIEDSSNNRKSENEESLKNIEIHFGNIRVAYEMANLLNQAKRNNGKAIIEI